MAQVVALTEYPPLIEQTQLFPIDAIERARELLADIKSVGAYTHSKGVLSIRKHVAGFLQGKVAIELACKK